MQAQVIVKNKPAFDYKFRYRNRDYKDVLCNVLLGETDEQTILNVVESLNMNGFVVVYDDEMLRHIQSFVDDPETYILLD